MYGSVSLCTARIRCPGAMSRRNFRTRAPTRGGIDGGPAKWLIRNRGSRHAGIRKAESDACSLDFDSATSNAGENPTEKKGESSLTSRSRETDRQGLRDKRRSQSLNILATRSALKTRVRFRTGIAISKLERSGTSPKNVFRHFGWQISERREGKRAERARRAGRVKR